MMYHFPQILIMGKHCDNNKTKSNQFFEKSQFKCFYGHSVCVTNLKVKIKTSFLLCMKLITHTHRR